MLCYYAVLGVIMLLYHSLYTADQDLFLDALETYFHCQALGHLPNQTSQCDPKEYQQYIYPELAATTYLLMGFTSTAHLAFVINWKTTCSKIVFYLQCFCKKKIKDSSV